MSLTFPKDFIWGAASAAHQVEGAHDIDGKGPGIWDALVEGHVKNNETGHQACDHYHRYKEDVALMKEMGLKAYRFSISWPRVMPEKGKVNEQGLMFYKNLVNELVQAGIEPMVTLYHWNMPMWVYEEGGWHEDAIIDYFAEYTEVVVKALSDKVSHWMTLNEPACFIGNGYVTGDHAPFENNMTDVYALPAFTAKISRPVLLAHGRAVQVIREHAILPPKIGVALNGTLIEPTDDSPEALEIAKAKMFSDMALFGTFSWWADPMVLGRIPEPLKDIISDEELQIINQPLDFLGYNCYTTSNFDEWMPDHDPIYPGMPRTAMGWTITPNALYWAMKFFYERYQLPMMVTENGMTNVDFVALDGKVYDQPRIEFLKYYLSGLHKATAEGVPVMGYMYWSIMDNFEWAEGYEPRFGLIYVDYRTMERTRKASSYWYEELCRTNILPL